MHSKDLKDILITIAIKELLANNWNKIDIKFLSKKSKISLEEVSQVCGSKKDLLDFWSQNINAEMVKGITIKELEEVPIKERILELMLCRFDVLKPKIKEINALIKLSRSSFLESTYSINRIMKSMELILFYSGISDKGSLGLMKKKALSLIWVLTLREWSKGEIKNESALMAKIDQRLSFAEKINNIIL
jgi:ubiquinone biosynthesis protein COQ9